MSDLLERIGNTTGSMLNRSKVVYRVVRNESAQVAGQEQNIMNIKPIRTRADYRAALQQIESVMNARANSPEGETLDLLTTLVEAYERKNFPLEHPDPIDAIKFAMEQQGLAAKDLTPMIGRLNRVYEVLSRKRPLTLPMIWKLHRELGIPAESLIRQTR